MTESVHKLKQQLDECARKLQASEARFRDVVTRSLDGILVADKSGIVRLVNPAAEGLLGRPADQLVGEKFVYPLRAGATSELNLPRGEAEAMVVEMRVAETEWEGAPAYLASLRDITAHKRVEEAEHEQRALAEALRDTASALNSTLHLDEVLDRILANVGRVVPHDAASIMLVDAESGQAYTVRRQGYLEPGTESAVMQLRFHVVDAPTLREMTESGRPLAVSDTQTDPRWIDRPPTRWIRSYASAPIRTKDGQVIGFLNLNSATDGFFSRVHAERLQTFADQAAVAIENARLFQSILQSAENRAILFRASREIAASLDPEQVYAATHRASQQLMPAEAFAITLLDEAGQEIEPVYLFDRSGRVEAPRIPAHHGLSGHIIATGEAVRMDDVERNTEVDVVRFGDPEHVRSILAVPLRQGNVVFGVLSTQSYQPNAFTPDDQLVLSALANQAAIAIVNARLFESERVAREQAETLQAATQALSATLDLQEVFDLILSELRKVVPYDSASVQQLNGNELEIIGGHGFPNLEELIGVRFDLVAGNNPNREVVHTRGPIIVGDAPTRYSDFHREPHAQAGIRAWLGVPLLFGDRLIGMIALDKQTPGFYTEHHAHLAQAFAAQAAIAIENAQLYEATRRSAEQLAALHAIVLDITAQRELAILLHTIVERAAQMLDSASGGLYLCDPGRQEVRCVVSYNTSKDYTGVVLKYGEGAAGAVALTGKPLIIDNYAAWSARAATYEKDQPFNAVISAPMIWQGQVTGVIHVLRDAGAAHFTEHDLELLALFGSQAAIAVENTRLYEAARRRLAEQSALLAAGSAVSSSLDLNTVLTRLAEQMGRAIDATSVYIGDWNSSANSSTVLVEYYGPEATQPERVSDVGVTYDLEQDLGLAERDWLLQGQAIVRYVDDPDLPALTREHLIRYGGNSLLNVPLIVKDTVMGYAELWDSRRRRDFTPEDIALCQGIAQQAAIALANARLFEAERRRARVLEALHETGLDLSAQLDLPALLQTIVERATRLLNASMGSLYLLVPEAQALELVVSHNLPRDYTGTRLQLGEGLSGQIAQTGTPIILGDYVTWPGRAGVYADVPFRATVGVPITWQGHIVGVINVTDHRPDRFEAADAEVLGLFANQAAVAIANARLFEAERRRRQELETIYQANLSLVASLEMSQVLDAVLHAVFRLVPMLDAHLFLYDGDRLTFGAAATAEGSESIVFTEPRPDGLTYTVARSGESIVVEDTSRHPLFDTAPPEWTPFAIVGLPLKIRSVVIGVMNVAYPEPRRFTESELRTLTLLAAQAAIAIQNARLHEQVQRHADELEQRVSERTAELESQRRRMQAILDAAGEGILFTDPDWTIEYINPAMERITGYTAAEARGRTPRLWRSDQTPRSVYDDLKAHLKRGDVWHGEFVNRRKDGALYDAALTVSPFKGVEGEIAGLVVIHRDATRQKDLERLRDEFVSNVSHELRTPLANVKLYLDLLERGRSEKRDQYMQTLKRETGRLERLITDLLDLSRLDLDTVTIDLGATDLNQLASDLIADRTTLVAERGLSLERHSQPDLPPALVDSAMVSQVMSNLMDNAVNYTPPGGLITLTTAVQRQDDRDWVTFVVRDTGPGISAEDRLHLFERFFRGQAARNSGTPGTGLGLAICKEIVDKLEGHITVESQPGQGTAFTVWLKPA